MNKCPFLNNSSVSAIKALCSTKVNFKGFATSSLMKAAHKCPVMAKAFDVAKLVSDKVSLAADEAQEAFNYEDFFHSEIDKKKKDQSYRIFNNVNRDIANYPKGLDKNGRDITIWCSNDYLGMGKHPKVMDAMQYFLLLI